MHINYHQLRAFAAVARYGSFTRAARVLITSQSALSARKLGRRQSIGGEVI